VILVMENFKIKNKICFEAGGKREAGGDDKLTFFLWGLSFRSGIFYVWIFFNETSHIRRLDEATLFILLGWRISFLKSQDRR
jgi:hypothetical protein